MIPGVEWMASSVRIFTSLFNSSLLFVVIVKFCRNGNNFLIVKKCFWTTLSLPLELSDKQG